MGIRCPRGRRETVQEKLEGDLLAHVVDGLAAGLGLVESRMRKVRRKMPPPPI